MISHFPGVCSPSPVRHDANAFRSLSWRRAPPKSPRSTKLGPHFYPRARQATLIPILAMAPT